MGNISLTIARYITYIARLLDLPRNYASAQNSLSSLVPCRLFLCPFLVLIPQLQPIQLAKLLADTQGQLPTKKIRSCRGC